MILRALQVGWRRLSADPGHLLAVVINLALALASVAILLAYLQATLRADLDVPRADRVVRLETFISQPASSSWANGSPLLFHEHWTDAGAPAQAASRYFTSEMSLRAETRLIQEEVSFVDPAFVEVFNLRSIAGDLVAAITRPDAIAVSERVANQLFDTSNAIGKTVMVAGRPLNVLAVLEDRPIGSAVSTRLLVNIKSPVMPEPFRLGSWASVRGTNYVRLLPDSREGQLAESALAFFNQTPFYAKLPPAARDGMSFRAVALPDLPMRGAGAENNRRMVVALSLSCLFITLLAAINYVNIGTVRAMSRQVEISVRKALGADPQRVAAEFLAESLSLAVVSAGTGFLLAWLIAPGVGDWLGRPITDSLLSANVVITLLTFSLLLGLLAGVYPAWIALRVHSASALAGRGRVETSAGLWLRRVLGVLQLSAAMALIALTSVVLWQSQYLQTFDAGYDASPVLVIDAPVDMRDRRILALREGLRKIPGVEAVGLAWDVPGRSRREASVSVMSPKGQAVLLSFNSVGPDFFQSYGVRPIAGRVFDPDRDSQGKGALREREKLVINEIAARALGFASPQSAVGEVLRDENGTSEIIGVVPNIRQASLRNKPVGAAYSVMTHARVSVLSVRGKTAEDIRGQISEVWSRHFPDEVLRSEPAQVHLERVYDGEARLGRLIAAAALVALGLASSGVYAWSGYVVRRRSKELVLRKILGATGPRIARLLLYEFGGLLALGAIVALPLSAWLSEEYLSGFAERAPVGHWAPLIAFVLAFFAVLIAASRQALKAMRLSPASALRN